MMDVFTVTIERADARQRLDRFLAGVGTWGTRSQVHRLIADGGVWIDGVPAKPSSVLRCGQCVEVRPARRHPSCADVMPEAIPLDVLHEDDWLLIINKPPGLVVHPAPGHWQGTLVSALLHRWQSRPADLDPLRPGIVHRLDKDTSGVLVIAKDAATLAALGAQFRAREVSKEYLALVWGTLRERQGEIRRPIGRHPVQRKRMSVRAGGRAAITRYEVVADTNGMSVVRVWPQTGRTHQIRVHLAALGHPVVGDALYGGGGARAAALAMSRQALHAARIEFVHPHTGKSIGVSAGLPDDLLGLLDRMGLARLALASLTSPRPSSSVSPQQQRASRPRASEHDTRLGTARSSHRASPKLRSLKEERT
ncbi:MAG: RluA family pseudouridine synthase [Deltaproteobacteria bacterium]|nr:RluA family pseudouridine synthase [Deltaproteobacteria bacterium]MBI3388618.1 RluA family pseudouridine synthase [Deltaproteobacteria bacterium]